MQSQVTHISHMPDDVLHLILKLLPHINLLRARQTSRKFNRVIQNPLTWGFAVGLNPVAYYKFKTINSEIKQSTTNMQPVKYTELLRDLDKLIQIAKLPEAELVITQKDLSGIKDTIIRNIDSEYSPEDVCGKGYLFGCLNFMLGLTVLALMGYYTHKSEPTKIDCSLVANPRAFIEIVVKQLIRASFATGTIGGLIGFLWKSIDYLFCNQSCQVAFYQMSLPAADPSLQTRSASPLRDVALKLCHYRDEIAFMLGLFCLLLLLLNNPYDIKNDECIRDLSAKLSTCFQECVDPTEKNDYMYSKNREIFNYTIFIGGFVAYSFLSMLKHLSAGSYKLTKTGIKTFNSIIFFKHADSPPVDEEAQLGRDFKNK